MEDVAWMLMFCCAGNRCLDWLEVSSSLLRRNYRSLCATLHKSRPLAAPWQQWYPRGQWAASARLPLYKARVEIFLFVLKRIREKNFRASSSQRFVANDGGFFLVNPDPCLTGIRLRSCVFLRPDSGYSAETVRSCPRARKVQKKKKDKMRVSVALWLSVRLFPRCRKTSDFVHLKGKRQVWFRTRVGVNSQLWGVAVISS